MNDRDRDILGNIERRDREDQEQCDPGWQPISRHRSPRP